MFLPRLFCRFYSSFINVFKYTTILFQQLCINVKSLGENVFTLFLAAATNHNPDKTLRNNCSEVSHPLYNWEFFWEKICGLHPTTRARALSHFFPFNLRHKCHSLDILHSTTASIYRLHIHLSCYVVPPSITKLYTTNSNQKCGNGSMVQTEG